MIFGETALDEAEGSILAHSLRTKDRRLSKGQRLSTADIAELRQAGFTTIIAARLEPGDVHEDEAAAALAKALLGEGLSLTEAHTGRCNMVSDRLGLLVIDQDRLAAINRVDEALTIASLPAFETVQPKQLVATIKIIPFAVGGAALERCLVIAANGPLLRVAAFRPKTVGLVQTTLPGTKTKVLDKARAAIDQRLLAHGSPAALERRCAHESAAIAAEIEALVAEGAELVLLSGASAIVDRRDVVPSAITEIGGSITHFGMPVDPGNLLLLGRREAIDLIGLPGCARSPKLNGFDWVLGRLLANIDVISEDIMAMGQGGLLKEIPLRPLPRAAAVETTTVAPGGLVRVSVVILAAGRSTRMGEANKLLADVAGEAMVRRVAKTALSAQAAEVLLVTGHQADEVTEALGDLPVTLRHNPDYRSGLSGSLKTGLAALDEESDAVMICLGDMPLVSAAVLDRLINAFDPLEGRAICLPTWQGKRGNPVLFARRFLPEMMELSGDVGARALISAYPELVYEVPMDDDAVLTDIDTPEALAGVQGAD